MTEKLKAQLIDLSSAIERFREVVTAPRTEINRDASIQRFEFTFELSWKVLKEVLEEKGSQETLPKDVIRTAADAGFLDNVELWFEFLKARNMTSHIYKEEMAEKVYELIPGFLPEAEELLKKIKEKA